MVMRGAGFERGNAKYLMIEVRRNAIGRRVERHSKLQDRFMKQVHRLVVG